MKAKYIPGVCNIGPEETQKRERFGWYALAATALLGIVLVATEAPQWSKAVLFFPATLSALGFLQAWFQFCVAFGTQGLFKVEGQEETVEQLEFRKKDQQRAILLLIGSVMIGLLITASAFTT